MSGDRKGRWRCQARVSATPEETTANVAIIFERVKRAVADDDGSKSASDAPFTQVRQPVCPIQREVRNHTRQIPGKNRMRVLTINNDGGGFADYLEIPEGTTVRELFEQQVQSPNPENYLIRVNRQPVAADQVLQEGDPISFTPTKIEGA